MGVFFSAGISAQTPSGDLVTIGIADFANTGHNRDLEYLGKSLAVTIRVALKDQYQFNESKFAGGDLNSRYNRGNLERLSRENGLDIIIFGDYRRDQEGTRLEIRPRLYIAAIKKVYNLPTIMNPIDSTIIQAVNSVADLVLQKLGDFDEGENRYKQRSRVRLVRENFTRRPPQKKNNLLRFGFATGGPSFFYNRNNLSPTSGFSEKDPLLPADFPVQYTPYITYTRLGLFGTGMTFFLTFNYTVTKRVAMTTLQKYDMVNDDNLLLGGGVGYRIDLTHLMKRTPGFFKGVFFELSLGISTNILQSVVFNDMEDYLLAGNTQPLDPRIFDYNGFITSLSMKFEKIFGGRFTVGVAVEEQFYFYRVQPYLMDLQTKVGSAVPTFSDRFIFRLDTGFLF